MSLNPTSEVMSNGFLSLVSFSAKNTHTHTHTHTYIYIYIYICVCVCVCVCEYIGNKISSTRSDLYRLLIVRKPDIYNKQKQDVFQAVVVSRLLYRCITWTPAKSTEKDRDRNYTRIIHAVLNKNWLCNYLLPISQTIQKSRK